MITNRIETVTSKMQTESTVENDRDIPTDSVAFASTSRVLTQSFVVNQPDIDSVASAVTIDPISSLELGTTDAVKNEESYKVMKFYNCTIAMNNYQK